MDRNTSRQHRPSYCGPRRSYLSLLFLFSHASKIADFHPTQFPAYAAAPFFYSIGDGLKFSDHIDPQAPTLLRGAVDNFLVSPDNQKIAVVTGGNLVIVDRSGPSQRTVTPVNSAMSAVLSGEGNSKLIGQHYFRDTGFQWSRDAKSLYLMGDTYLSGGQSFSKNGELWRYDLDTGKLQLVLKPFPVEQYFFGINNSIYFWISTREKGLQLQCFDGKTISNIGNPAQPRFPSISFPLASLSSPSIRSTILPTRRTSCPPRALISRSRTTIGMRCSRSVPALTFASPWETTLKYSFAQISATALSCPAIDTCSSMRTAAPTTTGCS
jgi:hypothetical protein